MKACVLGNDYRAESVRVGIMVPAGLGQKRTVNGLLTRG